MTLKKNVRTLRKNRKGAVEGLPLQLMIIVMVAALGTGVIVSWMDSVETPKYIGDIDVTSGNILQSRSGMINVDISVTDENGNPLEGAVVVLSGCGITDNYGKTPNGITNESGKVQLYGLKVNKSSSIGYVDVEISKSGYGSKDARIVVIP